ncbi:MAG: response regulator [Candidatus Latescibacteria bacterium]|jgi:CheY-like chemotaxis protein|nr:response regulator [Candidatus Latescibacterota bacterium]
MHTLVVEDDNLTRRMLTHLLKSRGHKITACSNAEAAYGE